MMRIGVAMLQGARHEHKEAIEHASRQMNHDVEIVADRLGCAHGVDLWTAPPELLAE